MIGAVRLRAVRSLLTSYPFLYAVLILVNFIFLSLLIIGIAAKSGDFAEQSRLHFAVTTYSYFAEQSRLHFAVTTYSYFAERMFLLQINTCLVFVTYWNDWCCAIACCAKSPDFVPIPICRSYFSKLYFPEFVDHWNGCEVGRLRRAITITFCCYNLFILRRADCNAYLYFKNIKSLHPGDF
jgi:hypothetical protein